MYDLVIDVEDCEKKLMALPTNTQMRTQVEDEKLEAVARLGPNLAVETKMKKYLVVRKGKALLIRALRLLDEAQTTIVCTSLFTLFSLAVKKDRDDQLLSMFWSAGVAKHLLSVPLDTISSYLQLLSNSGVNSGVRGGSKSPPPSTGPKIGLKVALATPLGVSVILACLHRLTHGIKDVAGTKKVVEEVATTLGDVKEISEGLAFDYDFDIQFGSALIRKEHADSFNRLIKAAKGH